MDTFYDNDFTSNWNEIDSILHGNLNQQKKKKKNSGVENTPKNSLTRNKIAVQEIFVHSPDVC